MKDIHGNEIPTSPPYYPNGVRLFYWTSNDHRLYLIGCTEDQSRYKMIQDYGRFSDFDDARRFVIVRLKHLIDLEMRTVSRDWLDKLRGKFSFSLLENPIGELVRIKEEWEID